MANSVLARTLQIGSAENCCFCFSLVRNFRLTYFRSSNGFCAFLSDFFSARSGFLSGSFLNDFVGFFVADFIFLRFLRARDFIAGFSVVFFAVFFAVFGFFVFGSFFLEALGFFEAVFADVSDFKTGFYSVCVNSA